MGELAYQLENTFTYESAFTFCPVSAADTNPTQGTSRAQNIPAASSNGTWA
jgi:hypothetical protein